MLYENSMHFSISTLGNLDKTTTQKNVLNRFINYALFIRDDNSIFFWIAKVYQQTLS